LFFDATVVLEPRVQQRIFGHLLGHRVMGILPVGINPALFDARDGTELRQRLDLASNELVLIYIGSLSPVRRLHIVLEAFHQALLSELPLKLLIVGEGGAYDQLAAQAEALGLSENVIFTGFVDYHQVPDYLAAADIGLAFVPRTPGFDFQPPLKTLESMAGGLPTIATDTPANQEIIQHRRNGLICQDTVDSLAQAIVEGRVPPVLQGARVVSLDLAGVVAGTKYRGEFEERLRQIIEELKNGKIIAFMDELHTLIGAGGAEGTLDAANIMKPALSRGELQVIGATTLDGYDPEVLLPGKQQGAGPTVVIADDLVRLIAEARDRPGRAALSPGDSPPHPGHGMPPVGWIAQGQIEDQSEDDDKGSAHDREWAKGEIGDSLGFDRAPSDLRPPTTALPPSCPRARPER